MDNVEKVYTPTVIQESPFPQEQPEVFSTSDSSKSGIFTPATTKDQSFPVKRTAIELLSSALNTVSRKISKSFEFTQYGAIQIGKYLAAVSGDIRISPDGIVARNSSGNTTFALDGDTGDAIFAGQVRAGSTIVSNTIITEQATSGNGRTVYYNNGIPSIVIGDPS